MYLLAACTIFFQNDGRMSEVVVNIGKAHRRESSRLVKRESTGSTRCGLGREGTSASVCDVTGLLLLYP